MRRNVWGAIAPVMIGLAGWSAPAQAASIGYTQFFSISDSLSGRILAGTHLLGLQDIQFLELPRFNEPGTLDAVEIVWFSNYSVVSSVDAWDPFGEVETIPGTPIPISFYNDTYMQVTTSASLMVSLFDPSNASHTLFLPNTASSCFDSNQLANEERCSDETIRSGGHTGSLQLNAIPLSQFSGLDPINLWVLLQGEADILCDFDDLADICTGSFGDEIYSRIVWGGQVSVRYTYTPFGDPGPGNGDPSAVPEPSTWALCGLGLAGIVWSQRRRHRIRQAGQDGRAR